MYVSSCPLLCDEKQNVNQNRKIPLPVLPLTLLALQSSVVQDSPRKQVGIGSSTTLESWPTDLHAQGTCFPLPFSSKS